MDSTTSNFDTSFLNGITIELIKALIDEPASIESNVVNICPISNHQIMNTIAQTIAYQLYEIVKEGKSCLCFPQAKILSTNCFVMTPLYIKDSYSANYEYAESSEPEIFIFDDSISTGGIESIRLVTFDIERFTSVDDAMRFVNENVASASNPETESQVNIYEGRTLGDVIRLDRNMRTAPIFPESREEQHHSFELMPENYTPTGTINFSRISDATIVLDPNLILHSDLILNSGLILNPNSRFDHNLNRIQNIARPILEIPEDLSMEQTDPNKPTCCICLINELQIASQCGHMTCCECLRNLSEADRNCPICRVPITKLLRIYF
jgi:hypothetical protein